MLLRRLVFGVLLAVLGLLVVAMLVGATGTPDGPSVLLMLLQTLLAAAAFVAVIELVRRIARRRPQ
jgi:hypothetical protein